MRKFKSKRNKVYLHDNMVFKELENHELAGQEAEFLTALKCKGVDVPKVIKVDKNTLCLEYIKGTPLPDLMSEHDALERCREVAEHMAIWFESFYAAVDNTMTSEIRGDVNGRNFIITNNRIVGIDFEEHVFGRRETDFGRLLAYIATYSYEDTRAQCVLEEMLLDNFIRRFSLSEDVLFTEKAKELDDMIKRRK